jgi:glycosyltransferase involved in cell wall biosynthesis
MAGTESDRVLIAVLAYNEAASIRETVAEILAQVDCADVVVIDDGSSDDTAPRATSAGAIVIRHPINLGVAAGEATGLRYALAGGYRAVLRMDGDGQHDPRAAQQLFAALGQGAEVAVGSRYLEKAGFQSTSARRAGNAVLCRLLALLCGQRLTDPTSGFRAFGGRAIAFFAFHFPNDYPEPESLLWASREGFRIEEVPVEMRPRRAGRSSLGASRSAYYMVKVCLAMSLELVRLGPV